MNSITPIGLNSDQNVTATDIMVSHFYTHFKLIVANTAKLQAEVFKLRYKVYCQELGYEREEDCPKGMEQDVYDSRSIHCLLIHRKSELYAGCVRVVLPDLGSKDGNLPYKRVYSRDSQYSSELEKLPCHSFGEVSRLAVTSLFRKRSGEAQSDRDLSDEQLEALESDQHYFPLIALGLYLAATSVMQEVRLTNALTLMEPRLARHLRRSRINGSQVGELVEFHGQRALFMISVAATISTLNPSTYQLFQLLSSEIKRSLTQTTHTLRHHAVA